MPSADPQMTVQAYRLQKLLQENAQDLVLLGDSAVKEFLLVPCIFRQLAQVLELARMLVGVPAIQQVDNVDIDAG